MKEVSGKNSLIIKGDRPNQLHPYFVTGFTDAEGCFSIKIYKNNTSKSDWRVQADYSIFLHLLDASLLKEIQSFFKGVGNIYLNTKNNTVLYRVTKLDDLVNVIIPQFDKYPLESAKSIDYLLWKQCVLLMANKEHLIQSGLEK